ncbi:hypothetical protein Tco_1549927 [Tanacetum coccineum]
MIQDKCYNIHEDLRSVREKLNEGLSRFPDCKKLNKFLKKFEEVFSKKDLARKDENDDTTGIDKDKIDFLHSDSQMESDSPATEPEDVDINENVEKHNQKNGNEESSFQMDKEYVHTSLNKDDKVGDSSPATGVCSVIEGDEVKFTKVEDDINEKVEKEKQ